MAVASESLEEKSLSPNHNDSCSHAAANFQIEEPEMSDDCVYRGRVYRNPARELVSRVSKLPG